MRVAVSSGLRSVFPPTYRDARGRRKRTRNRYIEYAVGGHTIREAAEYTKRSDAIGFRKERVSDALNGKIVLSHQVTFDDLEDLIVDDYCDNGRSRRGLRVRRRLEAEAASSVGTLHAGNTPWGGVMQ